MASRLAILIVLLLPAFLSTLACAEQNVTLALSVDLSVPGNQNYPLWWSGPPPNVYFLVPARSTYDSVVFNGSVVFDGAIKVNGKIFATVNFSVVLGNSSNTIQLRLRGSSPASTILSVREGSMLRLIAPNTVYTRYYFNYSDINLIGTVLEGKKFMLFSVRPLSGIYNFSALDETSSKGEPGKVYVYACSSPYDLSTCRTIYQNLSLVPAGPYWLYSLRLQNVVLNNEHLVYIAEFSNAIGTHKVTLSSYIDFPLYFSYWRLSNGTIIRSNILELKSNDNLQATAVFQFLYSYLAVSTNLDCPVPISGILFGNYSLLPGGVSSVSSNEQLGPNIYNRPKMSQSSILYPATSPYIHQFGNTLIRFGGGSEYVNYREGAFFTVSPFSYDLKVAEIVRKYSNWTALSYQAYFDWYYNFGNYYSTNQPIILGSIVNVPQLFNLSLSGLVLDIPRNAWGLRILPESSITFYLAKESNSFKNLVYNGSTNSFYKILGTLNSSDILEVYTQKNLSSPIIIANPGLVYYVLRTQNPNSIIVYRLNFSNARLISSIRLIDVVSPSWLSAKQNKPLTLLNASSFSGEKLYTILYLKLQPNDQVYALRVSYTIRLENFTDYFFGGWDVYEATFTGDSWTIPHNVYFEPVSLITSVPSSSVRGFVSSGKAILLVAKYSKLSRDNKGTYILKGPPGISLLPFNTTHFLALPPGVYYLWTNATLWLLDKYGKIMMLNNVSGKLYVNTTFGRTIKTGSYWTLFQKETFGANLSRSLPSDATSMPIVMLGDGTRYMLLAIQAPKNVGTTVLKLNESTFIYESVPVNLTLTKISYNETHITIHYFVQPLWEALSVVAVFQGQTIGWAPANSSSIEIPYSSFPDELDVGNLSIYATWGGTLLASQGSVSIPVVYAVPVVAFNMANGSWRVSWNRTILIPNALTSNISGKLLLEIRNKTYIYWRGFVEPGKDTSIPFYDPNRYSLYLTFVPEETKDIVVVPWVEKL